MRFGSGCGVQCLGFGVRGLGPKGLRLRDDNVNLFMSI